MMRIYGDLFFWDDDYIIFWQDGFLKGIEMIQSFAGEQAGYGYDYACDIFTDIDFNPPLRLVGTPEANRIWNEQEEAEDEEEEDIEGGIVIDLQ